MVDVFIQYLTFFLFFSQSAKQLQSMFWQLQILNLKLLEPPRELWLLFYQPLTTTSTHLHT